MCQTQWLDFICPVLTCSSDYLSINRLWKRSYWETAWWTCSMKAILSKHQKFVFS